MQGNEIILLQHPVTTQTKQSDEQIKNILKAILKLRKTTIAIGPNSDAGNREIFKKLVSFSKKFDFLKLYKSIPRSDYLGFLKNCGVLVGNSSSGIIEAGYFTIPVVNIGIRQKDREKGSNVIDVEKEKSEFIYKAILKALAMKKQDKVVTDNIYGIGIAAEKITKVLESIQISDDLLRKQIAY